MLCTLGQAEEASSDASSCHKSVWDEFDPEDFNVKVDDDTDDDEDDRLGQEALCGLWSWLVNAKRPVFLNNEKNTLQFLHIAVGTRIPVYAKNMVLRHDIAMYLVKESKNAWIRLNYNVKPHRKFLSN